MKKIDNKGFSLIEMLVAVLISGLMMLGVTAFLNSSRVSFTRVNTSVTLQEEAGITTKFLNELILESKKFGKVEGTDFSYTDPSDTSKTTNIKVIWLKTVDNDYVASDDIDEAKPESIYFIIWEESTKCIRYKRIDAADFDEASYSGVNGKNYVKGLISDVFFNDYNLISRYADTFTVNKDNNNPRSFSIEVKFVFNGESYYANVNSVSRND